MPPARRPPNRVRWRSGRLTRNRALTPPHAKRPDARRPRCAGDTPGDPSVPRTATRVAESSPGADEPAAGRIARFPRSAVTAEGSLQVLDCQAQPSRRAWPRWRHGHARWIQRTEPPPSSWQAPQTAPASQMWAVHVPSSLEVRCPTWRVPMVIACLSTQRSRRTWRSAIACRQHERGRWVRLP